MTKFDDPRFWIEVVSGLLSGGLFIVLLLIRNSIIQTKADLMSDFNSKHATLMTDFNSKHAENRRIMGEHIKEDEGQFRNVDTKFDHVGGTLREINGKLDRVLEPSRLRDPRERR